MPAVDSVRVLLRLGREYSRWLAQHLGGKRPGASQVFAAERQLGEHRRERAVGTGNILADLAKDVQLDAHAAVRGDSRERQAGQSAGCRGVHDGVNNAAPGLPAWLERR